MPELGEQMQLPEAYTANFTVARALLRQGRPYEEAVAKFSPYQHIQDPNPEARKRCGFDRPGPGTARAILHLRQQPAGRQRAANHRSHHGLSGFATDSSAVRKSDKS